jgi:2-polyprenyl-6-methoxyphenol hydroxylase-like FAD-dependent oxidoreductase
MRQRLIAVMTGRRHAEIAGAGLTGLTAAAALAKHGWSVRVHERAGELREIGAGLYLKENTVVVLKAIGAFDLLLPEMIRLEEGKVFDDWQNLLLHRLMHGEQSYATHRGVLLRVLTETATALGVEIVTNSPVAGATPEGELILESGERLKADLVIGADGYRSKVRESVALTAGMKTLYDGATRLLVPRTDREAAPMQQEHWFRDFRIGFTPCGLRDVYVVLVSPESHRQASAVPVDRQFWSGRFPQLKHLIDRITDDVGHRAPFVFLDVKGWSRGRVAILGDAAHAQPPNLGQGGGMAMANALALVEHMTATSDVPRALAEWEARWRPASELVKRWSHRYGLLSCQWPHALRPIRSALIWTLGHNRVTRRRWGWLWRGGMFPGERQSIHAE